MIDIKTLIKKIDFAFQPIINISNGKIFAVEALVRNYQPEFNTIFSMFDAAYEANVLYKFDILLRQKAFKKFGKIDIDNLKLFYNLDNRLIYSPDYTYGNTIKILENLNLSKKRICFELSERNTLKDPKSLTGMVNRYYNEGFKIAIDDFGTGIAGLQLLYYTETHYIKIDRFFIEDINKDNKKRLFVKHIINLAHLMNIKVIAEGIETQEEYYTCKDIGADLIQGFFIQKPTLNIEEIQERYEHIKNLFKEDKRKSKNVIDKKRITKIESLNKNSSLYDVFEYFRKHPKNTLVPVVNDLNELAGVIFEEEIKPFSYSQYGVSLAQNKNSDKKLKELIKDIISVDINWSVDKILEIFNNYPNDKGLFVTKNGKYHGFITLQDLIALSYERNLEIASDSNPLTKLPGNRKIEEFIKKSFDGKNIYHIVYFDFDNFKPFNDKYGFRNGDRAIQLFADILKKHINYFNAFIGHIGGDDFFVGFTNNDFEKVYKKIVTITETFKNNIKELYDKKDRKNGYIIAEDRYGIKRKFPLLNPSALIIEITSHSQEKTFNEVIGELKHSAKKSKLLSVSII